MKKNITAVLRLLSIQEHKSKRDLAQAVFNRCKELGMEKTRHNNPLTVDIVYKQVNNALSEIRTGSGKWKGWSYRVGKDYMKFYTNQTTDVLIPGKDSLFNFLTTDKPFLKVLVDPRIDGVESKPFFKDFPTLSLAKEFENNETFAAGIFICISNRMIPLDDDI